MENLREIVASNLVRLRKEKQWTQLELAEKLNYSNKAVSRWEKGEVLPDLETLNTICELYEIELADILKEYKEKETISKSRWYKYKLGNKLTISLLSILVVWLSATILYVYSNIIWGVTLWRIFLWCVPISSILAIIFNSIWGRRIWNFIFISILVWTLLTCFYIEFLAYNIWMIYFIGIPLQIGIILWANLSSKPKVNK